MSDTPETDAVVKNDCGGSGYIHNLAKLAEKLERERETLKAVLRELLAIMPRATCENLPHDSLDVHPRSTHCWALQHFQDTVEVAKGLVYVPTKEDGK